MTLLVIAPDPERWAQRFKAFLPDYTIVVPGELFDRRRVRYVAAWRHPFGSLSGLPALEAIFSLGAGVDHCLADPGLPDVPLVRVADPDLTNRMSEYIVLHCLIHLRQQKRYDAQQRDRLWRDDLGQPAARQVRVGVMGLGELGRDASAKLKTMGFVVRGWSRTQKTLDGVETFCGEAGLTAFLNGTDIVVCLLPLTAETRGILNETLFHALAHDGALGGPVLINAGRGGLQVESDIVDALDGGLLRAATLDVFQAEPLSPQSPLWHHSKVTITPHNAAMSDPETIALFIANQIKGYEAGAALSPLVDRIKGY